MSSTGSTRPIPKNRAQTRLTAARAKYGLSGDGDPVGQDLAAGRPAACQAGRRAVEEGGLDDRLVPGIASSRRPATSRIGAEAVVLALLRDAREEGGEAPELLALPRANGWLWHWAHSSRTPRKTPRRRPRRGSRACPPWRRRRPAARARPRVEGVAAARPRPPRLDGEDLADDLVVAGVLGHLLAEPGLERRRASCGPGRRCRPRAGASAARSRWRGSGRPGCRAGARPAGRACPGSGRRGSRGPRRPSGSCRRGRGRPGGGTRRRRPAGRAGPWPRPTSRRAAGRSSRPAPSRRRPRPSRRAGLVASARPRRAAGRRGEVGRPERRAAARPRRTTPGRPRRSRSEGRAHQGLPGATAPHGIRVRSVDQGLETAGRSRGRASRTTGGGRPRARPRA